MRRTFALLLVGSLTACSQSDDPAQTLQEEAHNSVLKLLSDPESARFDDGLNNSGVLLNQGVVCGRVNAKNAFGGYVGFQDYVYARGEGSKVADGQDLELLQEVTDRCIRAYKERRSEVERQLNAL